MWCGALRSRTAFSVEYSHVDGGSFMIVPCVTASGIHMLTSCRCLRPCGYPKTLNHRIVFSTRQHHQKTR